MRFDSYLLELIEEIHEAVCLLLPLHEEDLDRKKRIKDYANRKAKIANLIARECEGKPVSFSIFQARIDELVLMFDAFVADPDDALEMHAIRGTGGLIVDDLWEVHACLGTNGDDYATAADHIEGFKDEYDLLKAGAEYLALQKSEDGFSQDGRTFRWLGKNYVLNLNPSKVVKVLFDAYMQGQSWLHQDYIKTVSEIQTDLRHLVRDNQLEELIVKQKEKDGKSIRGMWGLNRK
jgi:hypothetical protein